MIDRRLLGAALLAAAGAASVWLSAPPPLRIVLGLPLALFLPGFAWLRAASPERPTGAERATLAAGLSLAFAVSAGLALNAIGHLDPRGWAAALGGFTVPKLRGGRPSPQGSTPANAALRVSASEAAMFALALGVSAFAVRYAADALEGHREFHFTQLWMAPRSDAVRDLVTIGVRNEEAKPVTYAVSLVSQDSVVSRWPAFNLKPGETWTTDFAITGVLRDRRLEAWLRRADAPAEVYRKVWTAPVSATASR